MSRRTLHKPCGEFKIRYPLGSELETPDPIWRIVERSGMCGAVSIQYDPALKEELTKFFSEDEINQFETNGEIVFAYWDKRPLLPVRQGNTIRILDWGNRDEKLSLPKTGWARLESLLEKKWDHLKPKVVLIPAQRGCEKKVWFDLTADIKAVLVQKDGIERVYMITETASPEYKELTEHERMPRLRG